jgi:hypothetical protein
LSRSVARRCGSQKGYDGVHAAVTYEITYRPVNKAPSTQRGHTQKDGFAEALRSSLYPWHPPPRAGLRRTL